MSQTKAQLIDVSTTSSSGTSATDGTRFSAGLTNVAINIGANSTSNYGWIQSANWGTGYLPTIINGSGGNVGIGTTSPSNELHIASASNSIGPLVRFQNTGTTSPATGYVGLDNNNVFISADSGGGIVSFRTGGGSEKARIDPFGRLLVGTSTARTNLYGAITSPFQVESSSNDLSRTAIFSHNSSSIAGPLVNFVKSRGTSNGTVNLVQNGDELGAVLFAGTDGTIPIQGAAIVGYVDGTPGANDMPGRLVFRTTADGESSPTERMRVGSSGLTDIYSTNATVLGLHTDLTTGNAGMMIGYNNASSTQNGTVVVVIRADGDLENANNSYGAYSDEKLKENIVGAGSQWSDIKSLTVRKFNFKEDTGFSTHTQIGLIAQEVELVSPGLVTESPDSDEDGNDLGTVTKSVNYSVLYMKAVKALQEAMERIETLEAKVAALESTP